MALPSCLKKYPPQLLADFVLSLTSHILLVISIASPAWANLVQRDSDGMSTDIYIQIGLWEYCSSGLIPPNSCRPVLSSDSTLQPWIVTVQILVSMGMALQFLASVSIIGCLFFMGRRDLVSIVAWIGFTGFIAASGALSIGALVVFGSHVTDSMTSSADPSLSVSGTVAWTFFVQSALTSLQFVCVIVAISYCTNVIGSASRAPREDQIEMTSSDELSIRTLRFSLSFPDSDRMQRAAGASAAANNRVNPIYEEEMYNESRID